MNKIKVFCLRPIEFSASVEEIDGEDYETFLRLLDCAIFDVVSRRVHGVDFDIYCDDMGLFAPKVAVSLTDECGDENYNIVGNIVIARHDEEGNTTGLTDAEIELLIDSIFCSLQNGENCLTIVG